MLNIRKPWLIVFCSLTLYSCGGGQNFSEFPGFKEYFTTYVPSDQLPTIAEMELLKDFKPKIFKSINQPEPVDFYKDYISHGTLSINGKKLSDTVSPELLNEHRDNPKARFTYTGNYKSPGTTVIYGRVDRDQVTHKGTDYVFTFLTYNLMFPVSGVLQGLGKLQALGLGISGNLNDWHQLDHYVGVTIALLDNKPVAMTLQQHNYHTSYLLTPDTKQVSVDIAIRSNELYPHTEGETRHPAVSFLSTGNIEFMVTGKNKPMMAGYDITNGESEVSYQLKFLPQTDAFYQFKGSLGKSRLLPGRSGPPGADYATLPGLMPRAVRLVTGFRANDVELEIDLFDALFDRKNFAVRTKAIAPYQDRFFDQINR